MADPSAGKHFDVFLSHNSKDKPAVVELAERLKARGLRVWLDAWELRPGHPWQEALEEIIATAGSAAVLVGRDGIGPWQTREMRLCLNKFVTRGLPVIPVLLPGCRDEPDLPLFMEDLTWVDLRNERNQEGFYRLIWGITGARPEELNAHVPRPLSAPPAFGANEPPRQRESLGREVKAQDLAIIESSKQPRTESNAPASKFLDALRRLISARTGALASVLVLLGLGWILSIQSVNNPSSVHGGGAPGSGQPRTKTNFLDLSESNLKLAEAPTEANQPLTPVAQPKPSTQTPAVSEPREPPPQPAAQRNWTIQRPRSDFPEPEMVRLPGGEFWMGSDKQSDPASRDNERPRHKVAVRPFGIGKYEVTQGEWQTVMGTNPTYFNDCVDDCPVENVSFRDVQEFIRRLNEKTGKRYRLPSEAEWEYAARGGAATAYWWGSDIGKNNANCYGCGSAWDKKSTSPVGSFKPNPFGLYDTAGNVWEWTSDCWHDSYDLGAPADGAPWMEKGSGDCGRRVIRGGSWSDTPAYLRSAYRLWTTPGNRLYLLGFRLAQD